MHKTKLDILIVDDTPMNLVLLEQLLKDEEYTIHLAQGGGEALVLVEKTDFAVVLLDIQMPGMDGYETARAIKKTTRGRHTPIIFVTSIFQDEKSVKLGYEAGAVDYSGPWTRSCSGPRSRSSPTCTASASCWRARSPRERA